MKGIVFTEFLEMVEKSHGYEMVDQLLTENDLPSGGIYTNIGTYEYEEMLALLGALKEKTNTSIPTLLNTFGRYFFNTLENNYPVFFEKASDSFSFLESIDGYIHVEVVKLYPDAQLPKFETKRIGDNVLEMIYSSDRVMADFALGLIEKTLDFYGEKGSIDRENIHGDKRKVKFLITKESAL